MAPLLSRSRMARFGAVAVALMIALPSAPADARRKLNLVRDAEIEALVRDYARPLMKAAGLRPGSVRILIANDPAFNAFVSGRNMVINTGLLMTAETPNEVIGVIAHEIGHITGGHQTRLAERARTAKMVAQVGTLLGIGAGVAGAATGSRDAASAGARVAMSSGTIAMRGFLSYKREEERTADRAAVELLNATRQSGRGMLKTFERFSRSLSLAGSRVDPYKQSHPMPRARMSGLRDVVERSPHFKRRDPKGLRQRHDMARAKIAAYLGGQRAVARVLRGREVDPLARAYGQAILTHLRGSPRRAVPMLDRLIKRQPKNAYLHEMKGEALLRAGRPAEAVKPLRRAIKLDRTKAGILRVQLGHALVAAGGKKNLRQAIKELRRGVNRDPNGVAGYAYLAMAYNGLGRRSEALLASAEVSFRSGRRGEAKSFARRAKKGLKKGSPSWLRAQDILGY